MRIKNTNKIGQIGIVLFLSVFVLLVIGLLLTPTDPVYARGEGTPQPGTSGATPVPRTDNLLLNGSSEFGFYPVPQLGFEPTDIGNIPHYWGWFKSNTYGKYDIDNNENFRLICAEDNILKTGSRNAVGIYIQSTDQPDARLGIYQTVNVVPGQDYVFSISGTIQAQSGSSSPDINNNVILAFDHTGGSNFSAVPFEEWGIVPFREQKLEFKVSEDDSDLAKVEEYYTIVTAQSNKMTVFLGAWRRWANWRTTVFTFDCISLVPIDKVDVNKLAPILTQFSTTDVDTALKPSSGTISPGAEQTTASEEAQPASSAPTTTEQQPTPVPAAPVEKPAEIPDSGGILETKENWLLIVIVSVVVIGGLMGAGIWNIRRQKRHN